MSSPTPRKLSNCPAKFAPARSSISAEERTGADRHDDDRGLLAPVPGEIDEQHVLQKRMPGHWTQVGKVQDVTIWRRAFDAAKP